MKKETKQKPLHPLSAATMRRFARERERSQREYLEFIRGPVYRAQVEQALRRQEEDIRRQTEEAMDEVQQWLLLDSFDERRATKQ